MTNIVVINGSPKAKDSTSAMFIDQLQALITTPMTTYQARKLIRKKDVLQRLSEILQTDVLLFVSPIYVDALPAPLVKLLTLFEQVKAQSTAPPARVYVLFNCGFLEPRNTELALNIMQNFCIRAGLVWGYGVGLGSGGFILTQRDHMAKGIAFKVYAAVCALANSIQSGDVGKPNAFATIKMPRFIYNIGGNIGWRKLAKENGISKKMMYARPHQAP